MVIVRPCPLVGAPFCGAPVRPDMLNMPKSVSVISAVLFKAKFHYAIRLGYGPADATATPLCLAPVKSRMFYLSGAGLPTLSWKKGR